MDIFSTKQKEEKNKKESEIKKLKPTEMIFQFDFNFRIE